MKLATEVLKILSEIAFEVYTLSCSLWLMKAVPSLSLLVLTFCHLINIGVVH